VLVHELAHALAARAVGVATTEIRLFVFGGVARIAGEPADPGAEALVAMAGPLASVTLAGLFDLASWQVAGPPATCWPGCSWATWWWPASTCCPGSPWTAGGWPGPWSGGSPAAPARHQGDRPGGRALAAVLVLGGAGPPCGSRTPRWLPQVVLGLFLWQAATQGEALRRAAELLAGRAERG
jgi:hypothetical protein